MQFLVNQHKLCVVRVVVDVDNAREQGVLDITLFVSRKIGTSAWRDEQKHTETITYYSYS
jgi:hypothetical protein